MTYQTAITEKAALDAGEACREGVKSRQGITERSLNDLEAGLTYRKPPKAREKGTNVQGEKCGRSRLKRSEVIEIIYFIETKQTPDWVLAWAYAVHPNTIGRIRRIETWKHLQRGK